MYDVWTDVEDRMHTRPHPQGIELNQIGIVLQGLPPTVIRRSVAGVFTGDTALR